MDGAETISARLIAQAGKANRGTAQGQPRPLRRHISPRFTFPRVTVRLTV